MALEGSITDYAMKEDAIRQSLPAVTVCMIAKWFPRDSEADLEKCVFSYAVSGQTNELLLCPRPTFRVMIHNNQRFSQLCANLPYRNRIVSQ